MMQRLWILFKTQIKAWWRDPITALGGVIPSTFIMLAFGLLFGGKLGLKLVVINHDTGPYGQTLVDTFDEVYSPLDNAPYYDLVDLDEAAAWEAFNSYHIDGVWVIPADFSERVENGADPQIEMHFSNYNDDRAKNHRIYSAEILWRFYEKIGQPAPPLALAEEYPLPQMIGWFPIISVGIVTMAMCLGAIFNMYAMTFKEQINKITLEYGLAPRSLAWVMVPKTFFALMMGLLTGTLFLGVIYFWLGYWPGRYLW
ncbi:MAG: hypothetical protein JXB38_16625, partial [Anaerolineales bacterium]|nr:hypothetical protein [Anaerolineales bacterium]